MSSVLDWLRLWLYIISCVTIKLFNQDPAELSADRCRLNSDLEKVNGPWGRLELKLGDRVSS